MLFFTGLVILSYLLEGKKDWLLIMYEASDYLEFLNRLSSMLFKFELFEHLSSTFLIFSHSKRAVKLLEIYRSRHISIYDVFLLRHPKYFQSVDIALYLTRSQTCNSYILCFAVVKFPELFSYFFFFSSFPLDQIKSRLKIWQFKESIF